MKSEYIKKGSHIYVCRALYSHHGIYDGEGNVIHYTKLPDGQIKVDIVLFSEFSNGEQVYLRKYLRKDIKYSRDEIVRRASLRFGESLYDVQANNCEQFCIWAVTGKHHSTQVEFVEEIIATVNPTAAALLKARRNIKESTINKKIIGDEEKQMKKPKSESKGKVMPIKNMKDSILYIESVTGRFLPSVELGGGLIPLIKALNPLETIGRTIVEIMAYRVEAKRLEVERERIREQARVIGQHLQAQLDCKMQEIEIRRQALLGCLEQINVSSLNQGLDREAFIRLMDDASAVVKQLVNREELPSPEMFEVHYASIRWLSDKLVELNNAGVNQTISMTQTLNKMISEARYELEMHPTNQILDLPEN